MVQWIKTQWAQLPHQLQAFLTAFGAGVFTTVMGHLMAKNSCLTWDCMPERIREVLAAGAAAGMAFYMKPNKSNGKPPDPPPTP